MQHRASADRVGRVFARVVGTYFAGSLLVACIGGTWVLIVGLLVGVPLAPVAAVWYAVVSLIPQIGGFLGHLVRRRILALTQGVVPALIVLVLVVAYMNMENYVITPAIVGEAVDLSPPVTMLAALVGGAAAGVPGALAATPLIGTVKALYLRGSLRTCRSTPRSTVCASGSPPRAASTRGCARSCGAAVAAPNRERRRARAVHRQRRANLRVASGRNTATITTHQISARTVNQPAL